MKAYMFPGQGSQARGMGGELFDGYTDLTRTADEILGYSIKRLCIDDPDRNLRETQYTQPALYVVNALMYLDKRTSDPEPPDYFIGHSLGEYNALFAAGVFDFATGLRLVKRRGELMSRESDGAMAAVLNLEEDAMAAILREHGLDAIDVANINSPTQIVLSGPRAALARAGEIFSDHEGARFIPLNVSAAFHSRYMRRSEEAMATMLDQTHVAELITPVIANATARPYRREEMKRTLCRQICSPVQWLDSVRYLMGAGVSEFHEIGPGKVLTKLVRGIQRQATPLVLDHPSSAAASDHTSSAAASSDDRARRPSTLTPEGLGSSEFREDYNLRYAYVAGAMVKGIASKELVVRMARSGMLSFFGTGGLRLGVIEDAIRYIQGHLRDGQPYGMNLLSNPIRPDLEMETVDLYLRHGVVNVEAAAYIQATPALVKFRLKGIARGPGGRIVIRHRILAKVSRPEVAEVFLHPPDERIVKRLVESGAITPEESACASMVPLADDLCVEADSGGHTDMGIMTTLLPTIIRQRDAICRERAYARRVRVGAAGGIGTPEAAASAFILGADFVLTGSINQCTAEAGTSDDAKEMLVDMNVQDTSYAPAGDMFEIGARVQVLRRGVLFPMRANKLYELWRNHGSWSEIDARTREQIENKYFGRSFEDVWRETEAYYQRESPAQVEKAAHVPRHKMALVFRWYFVHTMRLALRGVESERVNYQVHTGSSMGAFNQWVQGTGLEDWRRRHVDEIGEMMMRETASFLQQHLAGYGRAR